MASTFQQELDARAGQLACLEAVLAANRDRQPREWVAQTDFAYLAVFDRAGIEEFVDELRADLIDARGRGTLENLDGNLRAWSSTASIYSDPELFAALTAPIDPTHLVEE